MYWTAPFWWWTRLWAKPATPIGGFRSISMAFAWHWLMLLQSLLTEMMLQAGQACVHLSAVSNSFMSIRLSVLSMIHAACFSW